MTAQPFPPMPEASARKFRPKRKIIQVAVSADEGAEPHIIVLCNDGTTWILGHTSQWIQLPAIPQPSEDQ